MGNFLYFIYGNVRRLIATIGLMSLFLSACTGTQKLVNSEWYEIKTEHFRIVTNGNPKKVEKLAVDLERFRVFAQRYISYSPDHQKLTIYALDSRHSLKGVIGEEQARRIAGMFNYTPYGNFSLFNLNEDRAYSDNPGRQTLFHEYTHFLMYSGSKNIYPYWFNEGIAEVFSTVDFSENNAYTFGKIPAGRALRLKRTWGMPLDKLLTVTKSSATTKDKRSLYASGWMLAHWMLFDPNRSKALGEYLEAYNQGADPVESFTTALGMTFEELNEEYKKLSRSPFSYHEGQFSDDDVSKATSIQQMHSSAAVTELARFIAITEQGPEALENLIRYAEKEQISSPELISAHAVALTKEGKYSQADKILKAIPEEYHGETWYLEALAKNDLSVILAEEGQLNPRKLKSIRDHYIQLVNSNGDVAAYWYELAITMQVLGYPRHKYLEMLEQAYLRTPRNAEIAWWYALELYLNRDRDRFAKVSQPLLMQITQEGLLADLQSMADELAQGEVESQGNTLGHLLSAYKKHSGSKALAVAMDYRGVYIAGFNEEGGNQAEANQNALQACEEQRERDKVKDRCELYAEGERLVNSSKRI
ncbi:hypothetical protein ACJJIK_15260 [Microbulbifer sp. ZKSA006]|uniref:hypothetical protein n=1 Tax=Microbulbifer sp. ZKSA006 TaxID=3243390 RepID=UPI004039E2D2